MLNSWLLAGWPLVQADNKITEITDQADKPYVDKQGLLAKGVVAKKTQWPIRQSGQKGIVAEQA